MKNMFFLIVLVLSLFSFLSGEVYGIDLTISKPTANQKIELPNVSVKAEVTPCSDAVVGKIGWETTIGGTKYTAQTTSGSEGTVSVTTFPADNSAFGPNTVKAVIEVDTTPPTITISGASNGATYYMPVSLTITYSVTDNVDPNPTVTANYPSGTVFDSEGSYSVVVGKTKASQCEVTSHFCEKVSLDKWQMLCDNCDNCNVHPKLL